MNDPLQKILTITTEYDENEDRIRFTVANTDQQAFVMWLTRRLAERMVPALVAGIKPKELDEDTLPQAVQAAQVYAQLEARLARKPAQAVQAPSYAPHGLIREISVKTAVNGARVLTFRADDMVPAQLVMSSKEQRQWLEMLRLGFHKGQWRKDVWPNWIRLPGKG
jgi:hypothetical protein